jgi:alkanesulfonate monooxygenase SsuD/methylene tetrahydromethanopterin reductase-like flavin-dependent oxidoreductase (luciferase family)
MPLVQSWVSLPWAGPNAYYGADAAKLARRLESLGVSGVVQGDHPFVPTTPATSPVAAMAADCLTVLTTVAAHSDRLGVATLVANVGLQHPLFLLRRFANLAVIHGGERVYAGLGAGWSPHGFAAIGLELPPHGERLDRLEEAVRLARELFDHGYADLHGEHVVASKLPLAPRPEVPPRLLLGGGSRRLVELAGRYADHLDLAPPPYRKAANEFQRKLLTTVADLEGTARETREAATRAGRSPEALTFSVLVTNVVFCRPSEIAAEEAAICSALDLPPRPLGQCPFVLVGEPERMAEAIRERQEQIGLSWLVLPQDSAERFCTEVAPLLT